MELQGKWASALNEERQSVSIQFDEYREVERNKGLPVMAKLLLEW